MIFADQKSIYGKVKVIDDINTLPYYCRMQTYKSYQLFIFFAHFISYRDKGLWNSLKF